MGVHDKDKYGDVKDALGIPDNEPIFILRGQDDLAMAIIVRYTNLAREIEDPSVRPSDEWFRNMNDAINEFAAFRADNPDKIKVPD